MKKKLTVVAALVLVLAMGVGGTLAYLTDKSDTVTNTFTIGNVKISLVENQYDPANPAQAKKEDNKLVPVAATNGAASQTYKMIPGTEYYKDPTVTVEAGSEKCYLFVKFEEINNPSTYLAYTSNLSTANGWTLGEGSGEDKNGIPTNVWYKTIDSTATDVEIPLLDGNKVTISTTVTNDTVKNLTEDTCPALKYTAYAIQFDNITDAATAWTKVSE